MIENENRCCLNCYWNDDLLCDRKGFLIEADIEDIYHCNLWEDKQKPRDD